MAKRKGGRGRRIGRRLKRRVKAAKPSLAIVAGLSIPAIQVVTGASSQLSLSRGSIFNPAITDKWGELSNRFKIIYLGGANPTVSGMVQSVAVKAGVIGFVAHWLANISGANRYLARMKAPVRI
jgi:hypothetical protein